MKIIYISNARFPTEKAHGLQTAKMCQAFSSSRPSCSPQGVVSSRSQEVEVELILPCRKNYIKESPFHYYGIEKSFKIKRLPCLDFIPYDKYLGRFAFFLESFTYYFCLFFYLLFKRADIYYTREFLALPFLFFKTKVVLEAHTLPRHFSFYSFYFKRIKKIVVITSHLKELFQKRGVKGEKILIAPDGVDIKQFNIVFSQSQAREKLNLPQDKKIVLYTGHLYPWKGAETLLKAAANFQLQTTNYLLQTALFIFVGGTKKDIESFKQKVKELSLNNVLIVGHKPHSEIPLWLKAANVLVLPNSAKAAISQYWTSPLKMFEYMAAKRPIIASALPSLKEVLNSSNALLVEPDSPADLAQGIENTLKNPGFSAKISEQAFQDAQKFAWQKRAEEIISQAASLRKNYV